MRVDVKIQGKRHTYHVHQLVAWAYHGLPPEGMLVCHKTGIETDNTPGNLYYGTHLDNAADRAFHREHGKGNIRERLVYVELGF